MLLSVKVGNHVTSFNLGALYIGSYGKDISETDTL